MSAIDAQSVPKHGSRTDRRTSGSARHLQVLYLIDSLGPGGAERLLIDYLPRMRELGPTVRVVSLGERDGNPIAAELERLEVPVDLVPVRRMIDPIGLARVMRHLGKLRPNVVHTQLEASNTLGALAARTVGIPVVSTLHTMATPAPRSREAARAWVAERVLGACASRIIAVSDAARRFYEQSTALPAAKLVTLRNGIDLRSFRAAQTSPARVRAELGVDPGAPMVATVAVLRRKKGVETMLRALPALLSTQPDLMYLVVGDGPDAKRLRALAHELGVQEQTRFTGRRSDVARLLPACDLLVHPTLEDALPTSLMEAMAARLPIVASAVGGVPEMVEDGITGRLVPPGDVASLAAAVGELLAADGLREAMGTEGSQLVTERFDLDVQAGRLHELYADVLACGHPRRLAPPQ